MGCSCAKGSAAAAAPKSYVVTSPNGSKKAYRTEVEAKAAATRTGGTYKVAS